VTGYHVEVKQNGTWNPTPLTTLGSKIQGTVIGQRQLWQLNSTTAEAIALVIDSAKDVPSIAEFGVMNDATAVDTDAGTVTGNDGTLCPLPGTALISDFTYAPPDGSTASTTGLHFGTYGALSGGEYVYPAALVSNIAQSNWHISGTVGDYSGFGLYFDNCNRVDASQYKGISFKISGTIGQTNQLTFNVGTLNDSLSAGWINTHGGTSSDPGRCIPVSGTGQYYQQGCSDPTKTVSVTDAPTVVSILWGDFVGGSPDTSVATPSEITHISWTFAWTAGGTPYPVDITLDDISFIP